MKPGRSDWPVKVYRFGEEPNEDLSATTKRLAVMWPLALEAWALMGKEVPDYDRANMPGTVFYRKFP